MEVAHLLNNKYRVHEVAKDFGKGIISFYDEKEFAHMQELYGSMEILQTLGKK